MSKRIKWGWLRTWERRYERYDVEILGKVYQVTPDHYETAVFVDGKRADDDQYKGPYSTKYTAKTGVWRAMVAASTRIPRTIPLDNSAADPAK